MFDVLVPTTYREHEGAGPVGFGAGPGPHQSDSSDSTVPEAL